MQPSAAAPVSQTADAAQAALVGPRDLRPLGQILIEDGAVDPHNLMKALVMRQRQSVRLGDILLSRGWVREDALTRALSRQWRASIADLAALPPDPRLLDAIGADLCLAEGIVPWRRVGGVTFIATARPEDFAALRARLPAELGRLRMLLCSEIAAREAILAQRRTALIRQAEMRVAPQESCRTRNERRTGRIATILIVATLLGLILAPIAAMLIQFAISRQREFEADRVGAEILGRPLPLANALRRLDYMAHQIPMNVPPAAAPLAQVNPLSAMGGGMMKLFSTHPPTEERVARLEAMAAGR